MKIVYLKVRPFVSCLVPFPEDPEKAQEEEKLDDDVVLAAFPHGPIPPLEAGEDHGRHEEKVDGLVLLLNEGRGAQAQDLDQFKETKDFRQQGRLHSHEQQGPESQKKKLKKEEEDLSSRQLI